MAGYNGYKMSNNAVEAYSQGEKPYSKWTKQEILANFDGEVKEVLKKVPVKELKEAVLYCSSWHHTSSYFNQTDFYAVDYINLEEAKKILEKSLENKKAKAEEKEAESLPEIWECKFLEWGGTRRHPKATEIVEIGEVKGNWFYRSNGEKKSVLANGFQCLRKIKNEQ